MRTVIDIGGCDIITCNSGSGRHPGEGNGNPLQYSCLGNPSGQRSLEGHSLWGRKELDITTKQ